MTTPATIIFDLDGTLVHSAPDLRAAMNSALAAVDRPPLDLTTVTSFIGNGIETLVERSLMATGGATEGLRQATLERFHQAYDANLTSLTRPYPGVVDCLARLRALGLAMGICTNKSTAPARAICDQLRLSQYFDVILGASPGVPKKPDAAPLIGCVTDLGGRVESAVFVGDSEVDVQTAHSAGVALRFFTGGYHKTLPANVPAEHCFADWATAALPG